MWSLVCGVVVFRLSKLKSAESELKDKTKILKELQKDLAVSTQDIIKFKDKVRSAPKPMELKSIRTYLLVWYMLMWYDDIRDVDSMCVCICR